MRSINYKKTYDFPNATGKFVCSSCGKEGDLPANYCTNCGHDLEEATKKGLKQ